ncbi:uncharacterized protein LOC118591921 [Onychomys torridus]|uniref:uncharacterized protein LOC118591921 n=1 Tax=Onychomys torridus TaxID=38674 RepID=UPI00167F2EF8|nr:uncharacterized protein LOC118591921 [Onychomys torridus]
MPVLCLESPREIFQAWFLEERATPVSQRPGYIHAYLGITHKVTHSPLGLIYAGPTIVRGSHVTAVGFFFLGLESSPSPLEGWGWRWLVGSPCGQLAFCPAPPAFATRSQRSSGHRLHHTAQGRAGLSLRCRAVPAALARATAEGRAPLALPPPPWRGPSLYYGAGDIQQDRLAQPGSPRRAEAGAPAAVCTSHPGTSGAAAQSSRKARRPRDGQPWRADPRPQPGSRSFGPPCPAQLRRRARTEAARARGTRPPCSYMAKFLAALLGCTLPSKGASPMLESKSHSQIGLKSSTKQKGTIFSTLAGEKPSSDYKKEQRWKPVSCSLAATCLTSPLIEKPGGKEPPSSDVQEGCSK